ncbi:dephospho-CoA kinase [soil metagenome]
MGNRCPVRIALTGGIGCGKSLVADAFAALGAPVMDADVIAREVVQPGSATLARVVAEFGEDILDHENALNRALLRARVFADPAKRRSLEAILHPAILATMERRAAEARAPYVVLVIPLLVETGIAAQFDRVLVVDCAQALQVRRLMGRDGETEDSASRMLAAQASRHDRLAAADDVVDNSGTRDRTRAAVGRLHRQYLELARSRGCAEIPESGTEDIPHLGESGDMPQ